MKREHSEARVRELPESGAPLDGRLTGAVLHDRYMGFISANRVREGVAWFEEVCRSNARWGLAFDLLGRLREAAGDDEAAYRAYRTGLDIALRSRRMSRELKTDLVVRVVEFCVARGWSERAEAHLDAMARLAPRHPLIERLRGADAREGMRTLARHLDRRQAAQALVHAARERFRARDWPAARDLYREAIEVDERCTNAYIFLARTLSNMDRAALAEGIGWFEGLVEARPAWGLGFNLLGQLREAQGDDEAAYIAFDRAAALSDRSPTLDDARKCELRLDMVRFCEARGWEARAEEQRAHLAALAPEHPAVRPRVPSPDAAERAVGPARAARDAGRTAEALRLYAAVVDADPHNRPAHVELVELYLAAEPAVRAEGIARFERIVARSPTWGLGFKLLGDLLEAHGDDDRAYAARLRSAELGLESPNLDERAKIGNLMELVDFCNHRGWTERALIHVGAVLALEPEHPTGRALEELLRERSG